MTTTLAPALDLFEWAAQQPQSVQPPALPPQPAIAPTLRGGPYDTRGYDTDDIEHDLPGLQSTFGAADETVQEYQDEIARRVSSELRIFKVPQWRVDDLQDRFAALNKRAVKCGCPPVTLNIVGESVATIRPGVTAKLIHLQVSGDAPQINGWKFVARLQHTSAGVIVRLAPGPAIPDRFRSNQPDCDHCRVKRKRSDTFVLVKDEKYKQVGRTCLADFTGHPNPEALVEYAEMLDHVVQVCDEAEDDDWVDGRGGRYFGIELAACLETAAEIIRRYGWTSRANSDEMHPPTAILAWSQLVTPETALNIDPASQQLAREALGWVQTLAQQPDDQLSDYHHNLAVLARLGQVDHQTIGLAASIVPAYERYQNDQQPRTVSQHFGTVGQRGEFTLTLQRVVPLEQRRYGTHLATPHLHQFIDPTGNVTVWIASDAELNVGQTYRLKATVAEHSVYRGVNQTKLTRCKVL